MSSKKFHSGSNVMDFSKMKKSGFSGSGLGDSVPTSVPDLESAAGVSSKSTLKTISKWIPLLLAGTAVAASVIAIKEIKNVRKELVAAKKENFGGSKDTKELNAKMTQMDEQLKKISQFLAQQSNKPVPSTPVQHVKPVVREFNTIPQQVNPTQVNKGELNIPMSPKVENVPKPSNVDDFPKNVNVINSSSSTPKPKQPIINNTIIKDGVEYEEVEVTDDEDED